MKSKYFNIVISLILIGFSVFFGWQTYSNNIKFTKSDTLFQSNLSSQLDDINKQISEDINITNSNQSENDKSSSSSSTDPGNTTVNFTNFYEMYDYAVNKYNNANYIYTSATGTATVLKGSAMGVTLQDVKTSLSYTKAKQGDKRYFTYSLVGPKVIEGLSNINLVTTHYTDGITYKYRINNYDITTLTKDNYIRNMNWNMTQVFHLPTADIANTLTDDEVVFYPYDSSSKEYVAIVNIDPTNFHSNFSDILKSLANTETKTDYSKIQMTIRVDKKGNFKSISFAEIFTTILTVSSININAEISTSYTETFTIIDNGYVEVTNPFTA